MSTWFFFFVSSRKEYPYKHDSWLFPQTRDDYNKNQIEITQFNSSFMNLSLLYSFWSFFFFCTNSVKLDLYLIWSNTCDKTFLTPNKSQTSLYQLCRWGGNTSSNSEELFTSRVWLMSEPTVKSVLVPTTKSPALLLNLIARRTQRTQNPDNIASPWLVSRNTPFFFKLQHWLESSGIVLSLVP